MNYVLVTSSTVTVHFSGQYVQAFRTHPHQPLYSLCIGLTFIHMASQKYVLRRHALVVQVINLDSSLLDYIFFKNEYTLNVCCPASIVIPAQYTCWYPQRLPLCSPLAAWYLQYSCLRLTQPCRKGPTSCGEEIQVDLGETCADLFILEPLMPPAFQVLKIDIL